MHFASSPMTEDRLSSLTEHKPIYSASHENAGIVLLKLVDYEECVCSDIKELVSWLHRVHLCVDEAVSTFGFYKVDFTCGEFLIGANISGPETVPIADRLLQFALEVMHALRKVKSPITNCSLRVQVALTVGPVQSAILGKAALKFGIHGKAEIDSRMLIQHLKNDQDIIASKDFVNTLRGSSADWMMLPLAGDVLMKEAYLYLASGHSEESTKSLQSGKGLSMCFPDPVKERKFLQFQARWLQGADVFYLGCSLSRLIHLYSGLDPLITLALTVLSLSYILKNSLYISYRPRVLSMFYLLTNLLLLLTPCCLLSKDAPLESACDMMQFMGGLILFPFQALLVVFSFILWVLSQWNACSAILDDLENIEAKFWQIISQLVLVFALPCWISYKIEKYQRQIFAFEKQKDD